MTCRICLDEDNLENLIQPCDCTGTAAYVHEECLLNWLKVSKRTDCEICKFEYDTVEVEEKKITWCPKFRLSDSPKVDAIIVAVGILGHFTFMYFTSFWGTTTEDMFIYGNICQGFMILVLHPKINPREVLFFWKICSSVTLSLSSLVQGGLNYVWYELMITAVVGIHMYIHLIIEAKQMVRYININDRSTNDETVPGP